MTQQMVYTRFAETGRVALVQDGAKADGKLVAILDFVDQVKSNRTMLSFTAHHAEISAVPDQLPS